jgi:hypothetical protein
VRFLRRIPLSIAPSLHGELVTEAVDRPDGRAEERGVERGRVPRADCLVLAVKRLADSPEDARERPACAPARMGEEEEEGA